MEFGPDAEFFIDEDGDPVAMEDGKFWVLGPKGKSVVPDVTLLTGEEPFVHRISREEAFERAGVTAKRAA